jgi:hypothetical protein
MDAPGHASGTPLDGADPADLIESRPELEAKYKWWVARALARIIRLRPATMIGGAPLAESGQRVLSVAEYALLLDGSRGFAWLRPEETPLNRKNLFWHASNIDLLHADGLVAYTRTKGNKVRCNDEHYSFPADCCMPRALSTARLGPYCAGRHGIRDLATRVRLEHERIPEYTRGKYCVQFCGLDTDGPWPEIWERRSAGRRCSCALAIQPWCQLPDLFHAPRPGTLVKYFAHRLDYPRRRMAVIRIIALSSALGRYFFRPFRAIRLPLVPDRLEG